MNPLDGLHLMSIANDVYRIERFYRKKKNLSKHKRSEQSKIHVSTKSLNPLKTPNIHLVSSFKKNRY